MQSIMKQFEARDISKEEVKTYTKIFGQQRAMNHFKVNSVLAFRNYLKEIIGDENYGLLPQISARPGFNLGTDKGGDGWLVQIIVDTISSLRAANEEKDAIIATQREELEKYLALDGTRWESDVVRILETCQAR